MALARFHKDTSSLRCSEVYSPDWMTLLMTPRATSSVIHPFEDCEYAKFKQIVVNQTCRVRFSVVDSLSLSLHETLTLGPRKHAIFTLLTTGSRYPQRS